MSLCGSSVCDITRKKKRIIIDDTRRGKIMSQKRKASILQPSQKDQTDRYHISKVSDISKVSNVSNVSRSAIPVSNAVFNRLDTLNEELLLIILSWLSLEDINECGLVSHKFNRLSNDNKVRIFVLFN